LRSLNRIFHIYYFFIVYSNFIFLRRALTIHETKTDKTKSAGLILLRMSRRKFLFSE